MKRVGSQPPDVFTREGPELDLADFRPGVPDGGQLAHQRVSGIDLVVPICPNQQQAPHVRLDQKILGEVERRRVEPLQVVEEQRQRMFRSGEYAEKATKHELE